MKHVQRTFYPITTSASGMFHFHRKRWINPYICLAPEGSGSQNV